MPPRPSASAAALLLLLSAALASAPAAGRSLPAPPAPRARLLAAARAALDAGGARGDVWAAAAAAAAGRPVVRQDTRGDRGFFVKPMVERSPASVVVTHGLDGSGQEWGYIALMISYLSLNYVRFVLPTAPSRPVTYLQRNANSWFDIKLDASQRDKFKVVDEYVQCNATELDASVARVEALIQAEVDAGVPAGRIFLLGFSQGGALAITAFMRTRHALGGMMGVSTWMPQQASYPARDSRATLNASILLQHGEADEVVDMRWMQTTVARLAAVGRNVTAKTYPREGHVLVNRRVIDEIEKFISTRAPGEGRVLKKVIEDITRQFVGASRSIDNIKPGRRG